MATGLQHSRPWEQPADSVQEHGRAGQPCAAGHQRHAQKGLHLYLNSPELFSGIQADALINSVSVATPLIT